MSDPLDIPSFLRISQEERRAGWAAWTANHSASVATRAQREVELARARHDALKAAIRRQNDQPRFEAMREKAAQEKAEREAVAEAVRRRT